MFSQKLVCAMGSGGKGKGGRERGCGPTSHPVRVCHHRRSFRCSVERRIGWEKGLWVIDERKKENLPLWTHPPPTVGLLPLGRRREGEDGRGEGGRERRDYIDRFI